MEAYLGMNHDKNRSKKLGAFLCGGLYPSGSKTGIAACERSFIHKAELERTTRSPVASGFSCKRQTNDCIHLWDGRLISRASKQNVWNSTSFSLS